MSLLGKTKESVAIGCGDESCHRAGRPTDLTRKIVCRLRFLFSSLRFPRASRQQPPRVNLTSRSSCAESAQVSPFPTFSRCLRALRLLTGEGPDRLPRRSSTCNVRLKRQTNPLFTLFPRLVGPSVNPSQFLL